MNTELFIEMCREDPQFVRNQTEFVYGSSAAGNDSGSRQVAKALLAYWKTTGNNDRIHAMTYAAYGAAGLEAITTE